jgi:DNA-binding MarR family transcriptional regulator
MILPKYRPLPVEGWNMNVKSGLPDDLVLEPITDAEIPQIGNIELLFFAYRDFTADPDRILARFGFGRAHHRALYFVNRRPGMTVADLIAILGITKQSLARVLRQLINSGHIRQVEGRMDRRQRLLFPTHAGRELILELSLPQSRRIEAALMESVYGREETISSFMRAMMNPDERARGRAGAGAGQTADPGGAD